MTDLLSGVYADTGQARRTLSRGAAGQHTLADEAEVAARALGVFVDAAVTIIVYPIAGFGRGVTTLAARIEETFIGLAIAIIVAPVAEFGLWADGVFACAQPTVGFA